MSQLLHRINFASTSEYLHMLIAWASTPEHAGLLLSGLAVALASIAMGPKRLVALFKRLQPQMFALAMEVAEAAAKKVRQVAGAVEKESPNDPRYEFLNALANMLAGESDPAEGLKKVGQLLLWIFPPLPLSLAAWRKYRIKRDVRTAATRVAFEKWAALSTFAVSDEQAEIGRAIAEAYLGRKLKHVLSSYGPGQILEAATTQYKEESSWRRRNSTRAFKAIAELMSKHAETLGTVATRGEERKTRRRERAVDLVTNNLEFFEGLVAQKEQMAAMFGTGKAGPQLVNTAGAPLHSKVGKPGSPDREVERDRERSYSGHPAGNGSRERASV